MIRVTCACGGQIDAGDGLAGETVVCARCKRTVRLPVAAKNPFNVDLGGVSVLRDLDPADPINVVGRKKRSLMEWPLVLAWLVPLFACCLLPFVGIKPDQLEKNATGLLGSGQRGEGKPLLAESPEAWAEEVKAFMGRDDFEYGLQHRDQMIKDGRAFWVETKTPVSVIRRWEGLFEVQVLSGPHAGRRGWIAMPWVKELSRELREIPNVTHSLKVDRDA